MIGILLLSHGEMAKGLKNSCELFYGENIDQLGALCLREGDSLDKFDEKIKSCIAELDDGSGIVVFCDLMGGTPGNRSMLILNDRVQVITGMNLGIVMEMISLRLTYETVNDVDIHSLIQTGKEGIVSLNEVIKKELKNKERKYL